MKKRLRLKKEKQFKRNEQLRKKINENFTKLVGAFNDYYTKESPFVKAVKQNRKNFLNKVQGYENRTST